MSINTNGNIEGRMGQRGGGAEGGIDRGGRPGAGTGMGTNTGSGNTSKPWGLMGGARSESPSDGRSQYYRRVGAANEQQTRTYDNGTSLTFGPNDLVAEPIPGGSFDQQFLEVNNAVRDLQVTNSQGSVANNTDPGSNNAPYQSFRTSFPPPQQLQVAQYPDGTRYYVVPSRMASVELLPHVRSLVRHSSDLPGEAYTGDVDTRFGDQRPQLAQTNVARRLEYFGNRITGSNPNVVRNGGNFGNHQEGYGPWHPDWIRHGNANVTNFPGNIRGGPAPPPRLTTEGPPPLIHPPGDQLFTLAPPAEPFTGGPLVDQLSSAPQPDTARFEDSGLSKVLRDYDEKREKD